MVDVHFCPSCFNDFEDEYLLSQNYSRLSRIPTATDDKLFSPIYNGVYLVSGKFERIIKMKTLALEMEKRHSTVIYGPLGQPHG